MVLHNFECPEGHITEKLVDVNQSGWETQKCSDVCDSPAERVFLSKRIQALHRLPITIYKGPDGSVRFPGAANEAMPDQYRKEGFQRVELSYYEAKKFQNEFNAQERARHSDKLEYMHYLESEARKEDRSDLLREMRNMSPRGRDFAEYVISQNDSRDAHKYYSQDPGFHIEILD